jgi:hypothetical protein
VREQLVDHRGREERVGDPGTGEESATRLRADVERLLVLLLTT